MTPPLDRRDLLRASSAAGAGFLLARAASAGRSSAPRPGDDPGRALVLIQLAGGNDGLDTVLPFADDAYRRARPELAAAAGEGLRLTDERALHPALTRLHAHFGEGRVAIVEGVGYPHPNRSHFESFDVWHAGDPRGRALDEGWIGRLMGARFGDAAHPVRVVHLGSEPPYSLHSARHPAAVLSSPLAYRWVSDGGDVARVVEAEARAGEPGETDEHGARAGVLARLRAQTRAARDSSQELRAAAARPRPVAYPDGDFAASLRDAAALLDGGLGTRVVSVELGGFDTHGDQLRRRERLLAELDQGLGAFLDDLGTFEAGRRAVVLVFSEFGRRVAENASGGTDHGKAGPSFVLGHAVKGGLHGRHPSLDELDEGDLAHTTDFRSLYAEVAVKAFGVPGEAFLPEPHAPVDCVA